METQQEIRQYMLKTLKDIHPLISSTTIPKRELHRCATDLTICKNRLKNDDKKTKN
jgi:hypothetical protein